MPAAIAMAAAKLSPALAASSKVPSSSSSPIHSSAASVSTISIPVSAFHDPASNVITITPYIFVKTATVAEQMQALRQDKKIGKPLEQTPGALRVKRRTDLSKLGLPDAKPASVSRRNARERNRVKQVNLGFETLREHVPNGKKNKKMSKVQTLRSAAQYIKDLYMILHGELPALGSPTVIDENEPDSPIENSTYSVSDTDNDASLGSPEPKFEQPQSQQQEHIADMESDAIPTSPVSSIFARNVMQSSSPQRHQQQQHNLPGQHQSQGQQPLIVKTEYVSVLQQQLSRGQTPRSDDVMKQIQHQQPAILQHHQEQQRQQVQQQQTPHDQQQQRPQVQQQQTPHDQQQQLPQQHPRHQQQQLLAFSPAALRLDPLTCTTVLGLANVSTIMNTAASSLTFTEHSPISMDDEQCDNYMDVSPEQILTNIHDDSSSTINANKAGDSNHTDIPASPSLLQSYMSDVNMNVIGTHQNDFGALQHYYKSVRNEHFKNAESLFPFQAPEKNNIVNTFLIGQNCNVLHSPAPSLSSTASSIGSENEMCASGQYDYDNLDGEALLDISNWISELCSQGMHLNDSGSNQQASLAYSH